MQLFGATYNYGLARLVTLLMVMFIESFISCDR